LLLPFLGVATCRPPTEIDVVITTDVDCAKVTGTMIRAGADDGAPRSTAQTTSCTEGRIGDIVIVPSGPNDARVRIEVTLAVEHKDPAMCAASPELCVVARRILRFVPHEPLTLPIAMSADCLGVPCNDPNSTCEHGQCTSAVGGDVPDAGARGDAATPDAAQDASAPLDAGPLCTTGMLHKQSNGNGYIGLAINRELVFFSTDNHSLAFHVPRGGGLGASPFAGGAQLKPIAADDAGIFVPGDGVTHYTLQSVQTDAGGRGYVIDLLAADLSGAVAFLGRLPALTGDTDVFYTPAPNAPTAQLGNGGGPALTGIDLSADDVVVTDAAGSLYVLRRQGLASGTLAGAIKLGEPALDPHVDTAYAYARVGSNAATTRIVRAPLAGGAPEILYDDPAHPVTAYSATSKYLVLGRADGVFRMPKAAGAAVTPIDPTQQNVALLRADDTCVFFTVNPLAAEEALPRAPPE
jgi:hypothetical protein